MIKTAGKCTFLRFYLFYKPIQGENVGPGDLFTYFKDWKILAVNETIFEDNSSGVRHYHCMDSVMAQKIV